MTVPGDFWLQLRRLAEAYDAQAATPEVRLDSIGHDLGQMPLPIQRQALMDLRQLSMFLLDLYPLMASQVNRAETDRWANRNDDVA
jgi:hypothetical protein